MDLKIKELEASQVRFSYDEKTVSLLRGKYSKTGAIGQPRAVSALKMGMSVKSRGYNIYISGEEGTGRRTAVKELASKMSGPHYDLAYAFNFTSPEHPLLLKLTSPEGAELRDACERAAAEIENGRYEEASKEIEKFSDTDNLQLRSFITKVRTLCERKDASLSADRVRINLVSDGSLTKELPVVCEYHPTEEALFGQIGHRYKEDHLNLSCGSLLRASGGFFVVNMNQVLDHGELWSAIKLFAESSGFSVYDEDSQSKRFVRPEASSLAGTVKIILLGSDALYDRLCETDPQFLRLFKVCAEFDFSMPANEENMGLTVAYILDSAKRNHLKEVKDSALCELLKYSSWYAEMRGELTTKLSVVSDLLSEADYLAPEDGIDGEAVRKALQERDFANGITESRISQEIENGAMIISLEGTKIGVINGLAVMDRGLVSFGTPAVISVSVAPGSEGIVNIEHEAGLSGEIHDKGLLILEGYLRKQYARNFALSVYAGICFEQSYSEVDGDSASSSELFALLSAIGELPVRQEIAVTGSVNQLGDIQPVGGINEKITGFFDICASSGLTGRQGVIIPVQNVKSLILPEKVVKAIEERKFHIYPVSTVDQGMEILTLRPSGERSVKGTFPADTVNRIIEDRLRKLYELSRPAS
ncbi:MAG: AAA family ATPase [Sphaerochaetaceae bacterium]|nr:AAA family ATPase [Sphaerochaetaceae bacterium]